MSDDIKQNNKDGTQCKLFVVGWTDYDNDYFPDCQLTDEVCNAVAAEVRAKRYLFGGDSHQEYSACCPVLNNGCCARFSWRGWGTVIAMAYNLRGRNGQYDHMSGYMDEMINPSEIRRPVAHVDFSQIKENGKTYQLQIASAQYDNHWIKKFEARADTDELKQIVVGDHLDLKVDGEFGTTFIGRYKVTAIFRGASFEQVIADIDEQYYVDAEYFGYSEDLMQDELIEQLYVDYPHELTDKCGVVLFRIAEYRE